MKKLTVINWNVAGAKFLEEKDWSKKKKFRTELNEALASLVTKHNPDVITLQEIVEYKKPEEKGDKPTCIIDKIDGYFFHKCILIDTEYHPYVSKWTKVKIEGNWPEGSYFGQGNAILWRNDLPHFPIWELPAMNVEADGKYHVEDVKLMSGLYFGNRDTEPRAALVAHFVISEFEQHSQNVRKPLDIFIVNLHLTTLTGERDGVPQIDGEGRKVRFGQLDIVLNGIVSRYNEWRRSNYRFRGDERTPIAGKEDFKRLPPVWILCGDFNFTPESSEYAFMTRMNFVDLHPKKGKGTKGSGHGAGAEATITCDYIFAGPKFIALDPIFTEMIAKKNPEPFDNIKVSDHYPLLAEIPLATPELQKLSEAGY